MASSAVAVDVARVLVNCAIYALLYLVCWLALPGGRASLVELLAQARSLRPQQPQRDIVAS